MASGLLDFLESPDAQLGIGLLAAGGATTDPNASGIGARLANAVGYTTNAKAAATRQKLIDSQIAENESQNAQRAAALARQQRQDAYYLGGGPTAAATPGLLAADAGAPGAAAAGAAPNVEPGAVLKAATGAPAAAPPPGEGKFAEWSRAYGIPVDALVSDYYSNGGKGIADMLMKRGTPDMKVQDGYAYDANKIKPGATPGLVTSADGTSILRIPDPTAPGGVRIQAPEGALGAAGAYGAQKARTNAAYSPGRPRIDPVTGYSVGQSQLDEIGGGGGGGAPPAAPAAPGGPMIGRSPQPAPGMTGRAGPTNAAERGMAADVATVPYDPAREAAEVRTMLQTPGFFPNTPAGRDDRAQAEAYLARLAPAGAAPSLLPGLPGAGRGAVNPTTAAPAAAAPLLPGLPGGVPAGAVEFSPAAKAQQEVDRQQALARGKQVTDREEKQQGEQRKHTQMTAAADIAKRLLDEGPTGSGVGSLVDKAGSFVGQPMKGQSQAAALKAVGGWLVSNVPRMEGPQSDRDVANYGIMAGQVADETLPVSVRKEALKTVMELQNKYAENNGGPRPNANAIPGAEPKAGADGWINLPGGVRVREKK